MSIVDILSSAQAGKFFANAGAASGLSETDAKRAILSLVPAIAEKLKAKAAADPGAFDQLLDMLEDGSDVSGLDDADSITGSEALKDGSAILDDIYGSRGSAISAMGKLAPHATGASLDKVSAISATSVLAALSATNANTLMASAAPAVGSSGGGILSVIIAAVLKGLIQGITRSLGIRQRRRRRNYSYYYRKRPPRRRTRRPGLDDIFKSVLSGRR